MNSDSEVVIATKEAEACLLGAILIQSSDEKDNPVNEIRHFLTPGDFQDSKLHDSKHARIFGAMLACKYPHQINVARKLVETGTIKKYDIAYLSECVSICPCSLDYKSYAGAVKKYSEMRNGRRNKPYIGIELINARS